MTLLDDALAWHQLGYAPLPVAPDGSKRPSVKWQDFIDEPPTEAEIRGFWAHCDTDGIGLLCGAASRGLEMLEVEGRAVHLAGDLEQLCADNGQADLWARLQAGYVERTPSGGIHWYYRVDGAAMRNTKLARDADRQVLIETRGEGGFTVIAPSAGRSHPTGLAWEVIAGSPATIPTLTVDERDFLYHAAITLDQAPTSNFEFGNSQPGAPRTDGQLRPGDDYCQRATWPEILEPHGWTKSKSFGQGIGWTRPGKKPGDGISATTGTSRDGVDRLYVFSTSTEFETERPYNKFAAYALLEHNGDFAAAARALGAAGYGTQHDPAPELTIDPAPAPGLHVLPPAPAGPALTVLQGGLSAPESDGTAALAPAPARTLERSEDGHAAALIAHYGDLVRYCPARSAWLTWDGVAWRWQPKGGGLVREYAKNVARAFPSDGAPALAHKKRSLSKGGIDGCLGLAQTDARVTVTMAELDADPWTLNTPGGLVDLRTGTMRPADPTALCTKVTAAAPDFTDQDLSWRVFLAETFGSDVELAGYLQRLAGVTLIGTVREQLLAFCHGVGANGKSTLVEALMHALRVGEGGYAIAAPAEMLMIRKHSEHPAELAQLAGARMVVCSELDDGQKFAEAKIKMLTGRDSINARFLYGQPFTFQPSHTFWLLGNHRPQARTGGMAFWRRVKLIEFKHIVPIEKRDPALGDRLNAAAGVILAWAIRGAAAYFQDGIQEPAGVAKATEAYAADQDTVGRFVDDQVHLCPGIGTARVPVGELRATYERWCSEVGEQPVSAKRLTQELLDKHGVGQEKGTAGRRFYVGLTMLSSSDDDPEQSATRGEESATQGWPL